MELHNLTDTFIEKRHLPKGGEVFYRDKSIRGFALRVNWGGTKSFILECRVKGRVRRMTLGKWPVLTVVKARRRALEMKSLIDNGGDPTAAAPGATTFEALETRYIDHSKVHGKKNWKREEQMLALYIPKGWRTRWLSDITRDEIVQLHDEIGERNGRYASNRLITQLRSMLNAAIDWKLFTGDNPAARIKLFREEKRERFLSPEELARVNEALLQEPDPAWRAYFPLILLLGPRKTELLAAKWTDVDLAARTWLKPETKNGRSHLLPLPAPALAILERLPSRGSSEWLFPSYGRTGHLQGPGKAWERIRTRADIPDVRIHDLRRTLGSWLAGAGFSLPMIGKALNHTNPNSTAIYARLALDPVRTMLEANAAIMFGSSPK